MKLNHLFTLITSLFISASTAQQINFVSMGQSVDGVPVMLEYSIEENDYKVEGSPFLVDEWQEIKIQRDNGALFKADRGNYHIYLEELIVSLNGQYQRLHESKQIDWFEIADKKYIRIDDSNTKSSFAELMVDTEKIQLLKVHKCFLQKGKPNQGIIEATPDKYVRLESYMIRSAKDPSLITELKPKGKGAKLRDASNFPALAKYLEKNKKESFKDEANMARVLNEF